MRNLRNSSARDKPLSFDFRTNDSHWCRSLDLPPAPSRRREIARSKILLDAVVEGHGQDRDISYSRNRNHYGDNRQYFGDAYTHSAITQSVDELVGYGWLETCIAPSGYPTGHQSTLRASPRLLATVPHLPLIMCHGGEVVRLKDVDGNLVGYRKNERICRDIRNTEAINETIVGLDIGLVVAGTEANGTVVKFPTDPNKNGPAIVNLAAERLHRIYNGGWDKGGRFYGHWVQNVPAKYRKLITFGGQNTVERDYRFLHPRLLYAMVGIALIEDPYMIDGWEDNRKTVKIAFNIIINATTYVKALGAVSMIVGGDRNGAATLIRAIKHHHRSIAQFFHTGIGLELQYKDSVMTSNVMRTLRKQGIGAIPIHDSFIVPANDMGHLQNAMNQALEQATNGMVSMAKMAS